MAEFIKIVNLFFIYSFIGWLWETIYCSIKAKKFVYRGFLAGPYCPIYGFGILSVLYFIEPFRYNLVLLFFLSAFLVTILEYVTSYVLEKLFHAQWWNYDDVPLNINGRVAIPVSIFWGICCVAIVRVVHPRIMIFENFLAQRFGIILPIILLMIITADLIYTLVNMTSFQKVVGQLATTIEESKTRVSQNIDTLKENLQEKRTELAASLEQRPANRWLEELKRNPDWKKGLPKLNFNQRRLLHNYPNVKIRNIQNVDELKTLIRNLREK